MESSNTCESVLVNLLPRSRQANTSSWKRSKRLYNPLSSLLFTMSKEMPRTLKIEMLCQCKEKKMSQRQTRCHFSSISIEDKKMHHYKLNDLLLAVDLVMLRQFLHAIWKTSSLFILMSVHWTEEWSQQLLHRSLHVGNFTFGFSQLKFGLEHNSLQLQCVLLENQT